MRDADIHISGGDRRGKHFVAIADQQNEIGLETLKLAGELDHPKADRLRHRCRRRTLQLDIDLPVNAETVLSNDLDRLMETLQDHRSGREDLKLELGTGGDGAHNRLEPPVVGAVYQNDADLFP